jgi:hypothetical protein
MSSVNNVETSPKSIVPPILNTESILLSRFVSSNNYGYLSNTSNREGIHKWILLFCKIIMYPMFLISTIDNKPNLPAIICFFAFLTILGLMIYKIITDYILSTRNKDTVLVIYAIMIWYAIMVLSFLLN